MSIVFTCVICVRHVSKIPRKVYYYNAYSPGYDEYFVLKSYQQLPIDTITHFEANHALATKEKTGWTAKILSVYDKK